MANTLTTPNVIKVARAVIYTSATAVTVPTTPFAATLSSLFSTVYNKAKDIKITPPTGAINQIDLVGQTTSALGLTQTFQNYLMEEKSWTFAKISGTLLLDKDEDNFDLMIAGAGTATVSASYHWYQYGGSDSGKTRVLGAALVVFKNGTGIREILLNSLYITSLGDIKATGADGHIERDFEGVCAPETYLDSFKD
jgi:hypothetical protein